MSEPQPTTPMVPPVSEVTQILEKVSSGDRLAAEELLPILYDELRRIATGKLARELPGQTLQATALVHEAYFRLIGPSNPHWNSRAHFFGAAAEAMRRILVEQARRKRRSREFQSTPADALPEIACQRSADQDRILDVDTALKTLASSDPQAAEIVKLHFFCWFNTRRSCASAQSVARDHLSRLGLRPCAVEADTARW